MRTRITTLYFLLFITLSLRANNYVVTSSADAGANTLRQAITDANLDTSTPHSITFGGSYTIALSSALPTINKVMTIDGQANAVVIVGYSSSQNSILNSAALTLENLTFNNLISSYSGNVTATNCTFRNTANAVKVNAVTFSASNCIFDNNTGSATAGASVTTLSSAAIVQLSGCTITNNTGVSAIYHSGGAGSLSITNCTISGNTSTGGAAVYHVGKGTGTLTISNSIISNNTNTSTSVYGGGIGSGAATSITNCQISGNTASRGGGLALLIGTATYKSKLTMTGCTVSGNTLGSYVASALGGGIYIQGGATLVTDNCSITNCTISGNSTPAIGAPVTTSAGGGIQIGGGGSAPWTPVITISNSTIYGNNVQGNPASAISGGGIDYSRGSAVINYCIVIGNNSNSTLGGRNINATAGWSTSTTGRNMYEGGASWNSSVTTGNVILTESPTTILNTTLTNNGGTTALPDGSFVKTHALVAACAAINPTVAGSDLQTTDQRGIVRSTPDMGAHEYVTYRSKASGNWGSAASWQSGDNSTWSDVTVVPSTNVTGSIAIQNGHEITVAANATSPALTVNAGGQLTLNSGASLGITGNLAINSDADNGTGTVKDLNANGGLSVSNGTTKVEQHLSTGRNWYISSPVSATELPVFASGTITLNGYSEAAVTDAVGATGWLPNPTTFVSGKGYVASVSVDGNISFTGSLNTGNKNIALTSRTGTANKAGFNLVGNPYPSYLDWDLVTGNSANAALLRSNTMWYRTKKLNEQSELVYSFWTINQDGVGVPFGASAKIPPMQSFWVRAVENVSEPIVVTNEMRSHAPTSDKMLKAPAIKNADLTLVRLRVSNGINSDEAVVYFSPKAKDGMDSYDAPKMSNGNPAIPEIYTMLENEKIVINSMNSLPLNQEIGLGFVAGNATSFSIKANEVKSLPTDLKLILKDNITKTETDLTDGLTSYSFEPKATETDRFSLIFRASGTTTGINANERMNAQVFVNAANQITIVAPEKSNYAIYNTVGTKVTEGITKSNRTIANEIMCSGVYIVLISGNGYNYSTRIILNSK